MNFKCRTYEYLSHRRSLSSCSSVRFRSSSGDRDDATAPWMARTIVESSETHHALKRWASTFGQV